jgi:hypothetical protein
MSDQFLLPRPAGADALQWRSNPAKTPDVLPFRSATAERELSRRVQQLLAPPKHGRRKIWEFDTNLHCSIIGTCLSTGGLRQVLQKLDCAGIAGATEHEVHAAGVRTAGRKGDGSKLLHKALDRQHRPAINRFDKAKSLAEVRGLWREAVQQGDIPGAYWAALTHPATNDALVREIFTEVHMLSHLVGAANRADIRRLRQLEAENEELRGKVERQQRQLRDAIVARDATIRSLRDTLEARLAPSPETIEQPAAASQDAAWEALAGDLKTRLDRCETRRVGVEQQLVETRAALTAERDGRVAAEQREHALQAELDVIEASLTAVGDTEAPAAASTELSGLTLLYVGGRLGLIEHLRAAAERQGATLLHHDGGIEERGGLLPGLVSRADAVLFPVDCISHAAMSLTKRLCRQAGKPFLPLRSGGLAPFCAALNDRVVLAAKA